MSRNTIVIVSYPDDPHIAAVLGHFPDYMQPVVVDRSSFLKVATGALSLSSQGAASLFLAHDGTSISSSSVRGVWWRRPKPMTYDEAAPTQYKGFVLEEKAHFFEGWLSTLPEDVVWVNRPDLERFADNKTMQLRLALELGLTIPKTCISNNPAAARRFISALGGNCIMKSYRGSEEFWEPTRLVDQDLMSSLDHLPNCPSIFQERIEAYREFRVYVFGEELYAVEFDLTASRYPADVRIDQRLPRRVGTLPVGLQEVLLKYVHSLGLLYGAMDIRMTSKEEFYFMELNPTGQFLYLDYLFSGGLSKKMAELLMRERPERVDATSNALLVERPQSPPRSLTPLAAFGTHIRHME